MILRKKVQDIKRHLINIPTLTAVLVLFAGCTDELFDEGISSGQLCNKGEMVEVSIALRVEKLSVEMTTRAATDESEAERRVNDIWVFQYDYATEQLITVPIYYTITDQGELGDLDDVDVQLSNNGGEPCIIYVVANTGSSTWAGEGMSANSGFNTLTELKKQTIPNPAPIRLGDDEESTREEELSIPMGGSVGEDGTLRIAGNGRDRASIPLTRMFAKLYVTITLKDEERYDANMTSLMIEHIPRACTVAATYNEDGTWYYPQSSSSFEISRSFIPDENTTQDDGMKTHYGPFVMYVPENIHEQDTTNAMRLIPYLNVQVTYGEGDNTATILSRPSYTAYPGSWDATVGSEEAEGKGKNLNIQRNNIYDIKLSIGITENELTTPSANCLIASYPGETIAFYPYVRDEEMSSELKTEAISNPDVAARYDFSTYLNPSYNGKAANDSKKIRGVKIIWQTEGCIGNNDPTTEGGKKLVWIDEAPNTNIETDLKTYIEYHRKIYVKTSKPGNALIAAYDDEDCEGNILWSWHIWVPNEGVSPEKGAVEYYHYKWDSTNGINTEEYIPGRLVMNLALGALSEYPATAGAVDYDTYGTLYQWGRKDPFPAQKVRNITTSGGKHGNPQWAGFADGDVKASNGTYRVEIGVYDNRNQQIDLTGNTGMIGASEGTEVFYTEAAGEVPGATLGNDNNYVIEQSVRHPTMFIASGISHDAQTEYFRYNGGDWLPEEDDYLWGGGHPGNGDYQVYSQDSKSDKYDKYYNKIDAYLEDDYGPNKTIFDPCPYGWRVSPGDIWLGFTKNGKNINSNHDSNPFTKLNCVENSISVINKQNGYTMYMQGWKGSIGPAVSFFPTQDFRYNTGEINIHAGTCGCYNNATVDKNMTVTSNNKTYIIRKIDAAHWHVEANTVEIKPFPEEYPLSVKATATNLRCVRDTK
ncbi:MAG: hypothetical protein LUC88_10850 [Prevotella sp.]|nr:hypothetical protein [Prevotella sp.]